MVGSVAGGRVNPAVAAALPIEGWMSEIELQWLAFEAARRKTIVEFGCFKGRSTKALAAATSGVVFAVDWWNGDMETKILPHFMANLYEEITAGKVRVCRVDTRRYFHADTGYADMVFIDASHEYEDVREDIRTAERILAPGGLLCGHDFCDSWPGVQRAVREMVPDIAVAHETSIWFKVGGA